MSAAHWHFDWGSAWIGAGVCAGVILGLAVIAARAIGTAFAAAAIHWFR